MLNKKKTFFVQYIISFKQLSKYCTFFKIFNDYPEKIIIDVIATNGEGISLLPP